MVHEHFKKQLIESIELPFQEHDLEKTLHISIQLDSKTSKWLTKVTFSSWKGKGKLQGNEFRWEWIISKPADCQWLTIFSSDKPFSIYAFKLTEKWIHRWKGFNKCDRLKWADSMYG